MKKTKKTISVLTAVSAVFLMSGCILDLAAADPEADEVIETAADEPTSSTGGGSRGGGGGGGWGS